MVPRQPRGLASHRLYVTLEYNAMGLKYRHSKPLPNLNAVDTFMVLAIGDAIFFDIRPPRHEHLLYEQVIADKYNRLVLLFYLFIYLFWYFYKGRECFQFRCTLFI